MSVPSLYINSIASAVFFGLWQDSAYAGGALFLLCGFIFSCIDYAKGKP